MPGIVTPSMYLSLNASGHLSHRFSRLAET